MRVNHAIPNDAYNNSYFRNHFVHTSIDFPSIWIADLKHTYVDPFKIGRDQLFAFCRRNFRSVWRTPPQNSTSTWPDIMERRFATEVDEYDENLRDEDDNDNITQVLGAVLIKCKQLGISQKTLHVTRVFFQQTDIQRSSLFVLSSVSIGSKCFHAKKSA